MDTEPSHAPPSPSPAIPDDVEPDARVRGVCHILLAIDVANSVDLAAADAMLIAGGTESEGERRVRGPGPIGYEPAPLRIPISGRAVEIGPWRTDDKARATLFDFGAASIEYRIPFDCPLSSLAALGDAVRDHHGLRADARLRVEGLCARIAAAMQRHAMGRDIEDYAVFVVDAGESGAERLLRMHGPTLARILRGDSPRLADQEIRDALGAVLSYTRDDAAVVDWSGAILVDREPADALAVLEFANVELLEMRHLDGRLDVALAASHDSLMRSRWWRGPLMGGSRDLRRLVSMQTDAALMFEGVNNAIKLVGDQFIARLYRAAAARIGVHEWQTSVRRKLSALENLSGRIADHAASLRIEILEWIIILLIAFEVVMSFVR